MKEVELVIEWSEPASEEERLRAYRKGLMELQKELTCLGFTISQLDSLKIRSPNESFDPEDRQMDRIFRHLFGGVRLVMSKANGDALVFKGRLKEGCDSMVQGDGAGKEKIVWHDLTTTEVSRAYSARWSVPEALDIFEDWRCAGNAYLTQPKILRDIAYGSGARQKLDLMLAENASGPLHIFIHGGYWQSMDKEDHAHLFSSLRECGVNIAMVEYTLAPEACLEEQVEEIRLAFSFLWRQAKEYGYDKKRIQISGHSAGGHLGAYLLATDWPSREPDMPEQPISSAIFISGLYDLEPIRYLPFASIIGLKNKDIARELSPLHLDIKPSAKLCLAVGEKESDEFHWQSKALAKAWKAEKICSVPNTHHFSVMEEFKDGELLNISKEYLGL